MAEDNLGLDISLENGNYPPSRQNRSTKKTSTVDAVKAVEVKKSQRAISMHDLNMSLAKQIKDSRSVSFNGVSIMVDAALKWGSLSSVSNEKRDELSEAVRKNDIEALRKQASAGVVDFRNVVQATIEKDNAILMADLLDGDINKVLGCGQTTLHLAVEKEAVTCVQTLLSLSADPNCWDESEKTTPMHSVAVTSSRTTELLDLLLAHGGNINNGITRNGASVLHHSVIHNNIKMVKYLLQKKVETVTKTFHETALHVAVEHDFHEIAELLLDANRGFVDSLRDDKDRESALHVAAKAGYVASCRVLLKHGAEVSRMNGHKMTSLHLASRGCNHDALVVLLEHCSKTNLELINTPDEDGRTPLFVCSSSKSHGATVCMRELIKFGAKLDVQNSHGNTALHNAAIGEKASRVKLLISQGADLSIKNDADLSALHFINRKVPHCMKAFEERLDSGLKLEGGMSEMNSKVKIDFNKLSNDIYSLQKQDITIFLELMKSPYKSLLKHPLSEAFLHLKWKQIKYLHFFFLIMTHFIYSVVYTTYSLLVFGSICVPHDNDIIEGYKFNWSDPSIIDLYKFRWDLRIPCPSPNMMVEEFYVKLVIARISWVLLIIFTLIYVINETMKFYTSPKHYFMKWDTYIDLSLIISFLLITFHEDPFQEEFSMALWQWHTAAVGCFLTWLQMMFYIGKLPRFGKYVQMFRTVAYGVVNFLIAYVFLIVGFAVAFMILFPNPEHGTVYTIFPNALINMCIMMLGEIDYADLIQKELFPVTVHLFIILFLFLVSIILMNLLVGLAVSDIQGLSKSAKINQLQQQVDLINYMENWLFSPTFSILPDRLKNFLRNKLQGLEGSNYKQIYTIRPFDSNDKKFSESLKKSLYENCMKRVSKEKEINQNAQLSQMQNKINQMYEIMLGGRTSTLKTDSFEQENTDSKHQLRHSESKFSVVSGLSNQLQVFDDVYESDVEDAQEQFTSSGLSSIVEEARMGSTVRRRNSNISSGTMESDLGESDYNGSSEEKYTNISEK